MTPKTFKIKSFGCQMNVYDGERMAELLGAQGMTATAEAEDADLVVLNTCHIREHASEKVYSELGRLRDAKRERRAEGAAGATPTYDILFRMLEPHELAAAMGFDCEEASYEFAGTKTEKIKQIGNAVSVANMLILLTHTNAEAY